MVVRIVRNIDKEIAVNCIGKLDVSNIGYLVKIERIKKKRTIVQNKLYWMWLTCIQDETGNNKDVLHDYFREIFLPFEEVNIFGELRKRLTSTTSLTTIMFGQYLDKIQVFASSELGILLPNPDDFYFEQFVERYKDRI